MGDNKRPNFLNDSRRVELDAGLDETVLKFRARWPRGHSHVATEPAILHPVDVPMVRLVTPSR